jgi:hypothetical protein
MEYGNGLQVPDISIEKFSNLLTGCEQIGNGRSRRTAKEGCLGFQIENTSRKAGRKESAMGYNTKFEGEFRLDRPLADDTYYELEGLDGPFYERERLPSQWCQWKVGDDWQSIVWDGGEKFYGYIGWIRHINDKFLKPQNYVLNVMSPNMLFPIVDSEWGAMARLTQIVAAAKKHEHCGDVDWHWSGR